MTGLRALLDLQDLDLRRDRATRHLAELDGAPAVVAASNRLADAAAAASEATEALEEALGRRTAAEAVMTTAEAHTAKAAAQLASASDARIIDGLEREVAAAGDQELEALSAYEDADVVVREASARVEQTAAAVAEAEAALEEARRSTDADRQAALVEQQEAVVGIESTRAQVPEAVLSAYDELRAERGGVVAARFEGGSCRACNMVLSAVEIDRIGHLGAADVPACPDCGAILVRGSG